MQVECESCKTIHNINPKKHQYRPKLCTSCRSPLPGTWKRYNENPVWERTKREVAELRKRFKRGRPEMPEVPVHILRQLAEQIYAPLLAFGVCIAKFGKDKH